MRNGQFGMRDDGAHAKTQRRRVWNGKFFGTTNDERKISAMNETTERTDPVDDRVLVKLDVAAAGLGLPMARLRAWRASGDLAEGEDVVKVGRGWSLTEAGLAKVRERVGLEPGDEVPGQVETARVLVSRHQGRNPRVVKGFELITLPDGREDRRRATVVIVTPRVFTQHFRAGMVIECGRTETVDRFEYRGPRPGRSRLI